MTIQVTFSFVNRGGRDDSIVDKTKCKTTTASFLKSLKKLLESACFHFSSILHFINLFVFQTSPFSITFLSHSLSRLTPDHIFQYLSCLPPKFWRSVLHILFFVETFHILLSSNLREHNMSWKSYLIWVLKQLIRIGLSLIRIAWTNSFLCACMFNFVLMEMWILLFPCPICSHMDLSTDLLTSWN